LQGTPDKSSPAVFLAGIRGMGPRQTTETWYSVSCKKWYPGVIVILLKLEGCTVLRGYRGNCGFGDEDGGNTEGTVLDIVVGLLPQ